MAKWTRIFWSGMLVFWVGMLGVYVWQSMKRQLPIVVWVTAFLGIATAVVSLVYERRRGQSLVGLCPRCGYDLRATPDRCPECGTVAR